MKLSALVAGAALAGLALASPARAQVNSGTSLPVTGGVSDAGTIPRLPASGVPGDPGANPTPNPAPRLNGAIPPAPASSRTPLYPNGVPVRDIDAGASRAAQPRSGQAMPGAQPTKSIFKGRKRRGE